MSDMALRLERAPDCLLNRISDRLFESAMEHHRMDLRLVANHELTARLASLREEIRMRRAIRAGLPVEPSAAA